MNSLQIIKLKKKVFQIKKIKNLIRYIIYKMEKNYYEEFVLIIKR